MDKWKNTDRVFIANWLTAAKYPLLKWQWLFSPSIALANERHGGCLYKTGMACPSRDLYSPLPCLGPVLLIFLVCCVVFLLFVFVLFRMCLMLPVSLNCSFLIASCCRCLWIVHSWSPHVAGVSELFILDCLIIF